MFDKQYEHFKSICQDGGIKITSQRFIIFETLKSLTCHPTADQLYAIVHKQIPSLSKDTVYRTLNMFAERGLARKLTTPGGAARFDGDLSPHHHFLCEHCETILDLSWPEFNALRWPTEIHRLGAPRRASVLITGRCRECGGKARHN